MKKYKVIVDYQVRCSARGNVYVEANCEEDAMDMAVNEIDNTDLDEVEIIGDVEAVDVEEL